MLKVIYVTSARHIRAEAIIKKIRQYYSFLEKAKKTNYYSYMKTILMIMLCCFFASCGVTQKISEREFEDCESSYIQNEMWSHYIPVIHQKDGHTRLRGSWALYLYDDGRFIEKKIAALSKKKHTRKGYYTYYPETGKVQLTYTDKEGGSETMTRPLVDSTLLYVRKLKKGERAKYLKTKWK